MWRQLLYGVRFELVSYHATLGTLLSQKALTPRLLRLCEFMADFDFDEVKYCRGPDNVVPDFLSRPWLAGGDAEAPSPLHLLSHPRLPDDTADTAAPSPLEVCVLISSTAGMVVGSQGTTLMLPRLKCLPDEDSRSAAARLCGGATARPPDVDLCVHLGWYRYVAGGGACLSDAAREEIRAVLERHGSTDAEIGNPPHHAGRPVPRHHP